MAFRLVYLHFFSLPILKVKVKIMHILIVNISKMVTDTANNTIAIKYVTFLLSISLFRDNLDLINLAIGMVLHQIF